MKKISVIIPVYNVEQYLERCVKSVINQTYKNIEIILVDDSSTDSSLEVCNKLAQKDSRIKVIHKENGGLSSARNVGLDVAKGKYITFIDSDDVPEVTWAEKLYNAAKANDADIAFSGYDRVDLDTEKVVATEMTQYGTMNKDVDWNDDFIVYANPSLWNKIYRRDLVKDLAAKYNDGYCVVIRLAGSVA